MLEPQEQKLFDVSLRRYQRYIRSTMPEGTYKDFYLWAMTPANPHQETYLQGIAFTLLVKMSYQLFKDVLDLDYWDAFAEYSALMTIGQTCEVMTDHLAIGLSGDSDPNDADAQMRHRILSAFNSAMVHRLNGDVDACYAMLTPLRDDINRVSVFKQSMTYNKQAASAQAFLDVHPDLDVTLDELGYSFWEHLVINLEIWPQLLKAVEGTATYDLFLQGLIKRYAAGNRQLHDAETRFDKLIYDSTETILVMPTLVYFVGFYFEAVRPLPGINLIVDDGSLDEVTYLISKLVRLQNDFGMNILRYDTYERTALINRIKDLKQHQPDELTTIWSLMTYASQQFPELTRFRKDLEFGEFNLSLQQLTDDMTIDQALGSIQYFMGKAASLYRIEFENLQNGLAHIDEVLKTKEVSVPLLKFVLFHEAVYSQSFRSVMGEYAT